ncbi:TetR/AcrR family transcriptional regulator [Paenibacillus riograndensis]|uniref:Regulatory protein TetR n=2 Tax=Paenibacillus riograndensis TaxID=483937 RepID=A0A0E4CWS2_9BACL|nr:TetR/AcrR family transcriptional regulator [Paenibacillus riograndensis]CQR55580.1 regulatory protein TetR [Paenibacillus riograndensis SBR5]
MSDKKTDHRVRYTKMVIKESLLKLLTERSINKVTVTDICREAGINRNTFYTHYANQFELLSTIENDLYEEIKQVVISSSNPQNLSYELCKYIKANKIICEVLFSEHGDKELLERILYISHDITIEKWRQQVKYFDQPLFESWYTFTAHGSIAIIKKWVNSGLKESPSKVAAFIDKATESVSKAFYSEEL